MNKTLMLAAAATLALAGVANAKATDYVPTYAQRHVMTTDPAVRHELGVAPGHVAAYVARNGSTISLFPPSSSNG